MVRNRGDHATAETDRVRDKMSADAVSGQVYIERAREMVGESGWEVTDKRGRSETNDNNNNNRGICS